MQNGVSSSLSSSSAQYMWIINDFGLIAKRDLGIAEISGKHWEDPILNLKKIKTKEKSLG